VREFQPRREVNRDPANNEGHVEYMKTLPLKWEEKTSEDGERMFELTISTDRGDRTVDYFPSTGAWKVRNGKAEGLGIPRMARYFQIGGFPRVGSNQTEQRDFSRNEFDREQRDFALRKM
jgi:hypothetical protein